MKLNLGCGARHLQGYINVDKAVRGMTSPDVDADIRALPFDDETADEIIAIHVIEHFYHWEVNSVLREWARVLKPGGTIILECPDIKKAALHLVNAVTLNMGISDQLTMWPLFGDPSHKDPLMCHKWGYTPGTLAFELEKAGFTDCVEEPAQYHMKTTRDMRVVAVKI